MKRNPSLHILKTDLAKVMAQLMPKARPNDIDAVVEKMFDIAQPYQIRDRYMQLLGLKDNVKKKIKRSGKADAELPFAVLETFNRILTAQLAKGNSFRKVKAINKDNPEYITLKEIAALAYQFVKDYDVKPLESGFKEYVALGLKLMPKYALNKFKFYNTRIGECYESYIELTNDDNPDGTDEFYEVYRHLLSVKAGLTEKSDKDYTKFIHFLHGRRAADKAEATYTDWVTGQFEGLSFMGAVPEINQLYGDNALKRYQKYQKQGVVSTDKDDETHVDLTEIYKG